MHVSFYTCDSPSKANPECMPRFVNLAWSGFLLFKSGLPWLNNICVRGQLQGSATTFQNPNDGYACNPTTFGEFCALVNPMKIFQVLSFIALAICLPHVFSVQSHPKNDPAHACYLIPLPDLPVAQDNRTIPWGTPSIRNGSSTCCSSLDQVRVGIDAIDLQLLELLSQGGAAFVREATRFKATHNQVDVPSRDRQVIEGAVANAGAVQLPRTIAGAVFTAIINASVPFELCIVSAFNYTNTLHSLHQFDSFHEREH
ncbi:hypothetical protein CPB84DRAFT_1775747 [Gymnopilus junonius]|uniref:Chorismate mutase domain-containing protein n=1 Tax=Gymnopilus junonius TaxID=109634 RepID=A0A9P5NS15_GYMJU|nr:hypothetical protein CPB84DRAFT_1775747 [Gymnopilus junonius]